MDYRYTKVSYFLSLSEALFIEAGKELTEELTSDRAGERRSHAEQESALPLMTGLCKFQVSWV